MEIDADQWKSWGHARLSTPIGGRGALSLFEAWPQKHLALAKHLTAERKVEEFVAGKGTVTRWERIRRQNHWFDCLYLASAAAHLCGIRLIDEPPRVVDDRPSVTGGIRREDGPGRGSICRGGIWYGRGIETEISQPCQRSADRLPVCGQWSIQLPLEGPQLGASSRRHVTRGTYRRRARRRRTASVPAATGERRRLKLVKPRLFAGLLISDAGHVLNLFRSAAYEIWQIVGRGSLLVRWHRIGNKRRESPDGLVWEFALTFRQVMLTRCPEEN